LDDKRDDSSGNSSIRPGLILSLEQIHPSTKELQSIEEFHSNGSRVICTAAGLSGQSLGERCRLLLAGASELLDEDDKHFATNLQSALETIANDERRRFVEAQRLRALMNDAGIAGTSSTLVDAFRSLERLAPFSDLSVLITGETGTGKELFARAIHNLDPRRHSAPFVAVNCGSLPDALSESEMFGFRRGAFTGADRDRPGLFRAAHLGILFLDEIGELTMSAQSKFLRVLQTGRVLPLGEDREIEVDVRVVAATNRNLEEMVRDGKFREDLYHRINVLRISLPPLRERPKDIEPLLEHFARKHRQLSRGVAMHFSGDFVAAIQESSLPGNVRQLENLIRRALLSSDGRTTLSLRDLPRDLWNELAQSEEAAGRKAEESSAGSNGLARQYLENNGWNLTQSVEQFEKDLLKIALKEANGNQSEAARRLGISARSVYNKLHHRNGRT
jgi:transcriptional regulator with PAS, ATPase and Fis domain